jgi:hypothetical protein
MLEIISEKFRTVSDNGFSAFYRKSGAHHHKRDGSIQSSTIPISSKKDLTAASLVK